MTTASNTNNVNKQFGMEVKIRKEQIFLIYYVANMNNVYILNFYSWLSKVLYLSYAPPAYECGTRPFLRWVLSQGWNPHTSGSSKNASDPIDIPLFRAPQAPGDKPNPSKEGKTLGGRPPEARGVVSSGWTHPNKPCGM